MRPKLPAELQEIYNVPKFFWGFLIEWKKARGNHDEEFIRMQCLALEKYRAYSARSGEGQVVGPRLCTSGGPSVQSHPAGPSHIQTVPAPAPPARDVSATAPASGLEREKASTGPGKGQTRPKNEMVIAAAAPPARYVSATEPAPAPGLDIQKVQGKRQKEKMVGQGQGASRKQGNVVAPEAGPSRRKMFAAPGPPHDAVGTAPAPASAPEPSLQQHKVDINNEEADMVQDRENDSGREDDDKRGNGPIQGKKQMKPRCANCTQLGKECWEQLQVKTPKTACYECGKLKLRCEKAVKEKRKSVGGNKGRAVQRPVPKSRPFIFDSNSEGEAGAPSKASPVGANAAPAAISESLQYIRAEKAKWEATKPDNPDVNADAEQRVDKLETRMEELMLRKEKLTSGCVAILEEWVASIEDSIWSFRQKVTRFDAWMKAEEKSRQELQDAVAQLRHQLCSMQLAAPPSDDQEQAEVQPAPDSHTGSGNRPRSDRKRKAHAPEKRNSKCYSRCILKVIQGKTKSVQVGERLSVKRFLSLGFTSTRLMSQVQLWYCSAEVKLRGNAKYMGFIYYRDNED
ncbi:hypothetical protein JOM56_014241 [Amanita muscaria]